MGYISLWGSDFAASKGCSMYKVSSQSHIVNAIIKVDHNKKLEHTLNYPMGNFETKESIWN